ncbi:MAG TPA: sulfurtransferase complex subunit TusD [Candidatus Sulfotelmatobacter sp.]|jgi:tRNA 2-thiouridine synthesizing protein D|nr:sulfurtransferase complex subunit TusD [Candidatus Sulfotelmatobacter sp.]
MKFAILVTDGPQGSQSSGSALNFARAVLARGHGLTRVFFYGDGVLNANRLAAPPADERHPGRDWSQLAAEHGVELVVCANAAVKRGIREVNLAPGFRISGLGQLAEAMVAADRLVTFGS